VLFFATTSARADEHPEWTTPLTPFRITDNLYYVGSRDLASYLITTPQGDILINSNLTSSPPQIRHSVEQLGFKWSDIKILLISHAHFDHAAGSAQILRETHAKYMVMDGDVPVVESGGAKDFAYGPKPQYPPAHVDRILHDNDTVTLGNVTLTAHKTAGHTRGCTTWTLRVHVPGEPAQQLRNVVIVGSWNVNPGYRLVASHGKPPSYPGIAQDYVHAFNVFAALPCDIFLGAHGMYFDMLAKLARMPQHGDSVWIDPDGYRAAVAERKAAFETELHKQQQAASAR
jgi:metallo-beta-lactamase class B